MINQERGSLYQRGMYKLINLLHRSVAGKDSQNDVCHQNFKSYFESVNQLINPDVLEIGSRAVSGNTYRGFLQGEHRYTGFDFHTGPNVDVVGDAHQLGSVFEANRFDAVFSISVFEHLALPWQVVVEINKVMKKGGLLFIGTHHTYPAQELPWDFWRFSRGSFAALLNQATGFEIVRCEEGLPCSIFPHGNEIPMRGLARQPAYLSVNVVARKIGPAQSGLAWNFDVVQTLQNEYPAPQN